MPIVTVSHRPHATPAALALLKRDLPEMVAQALDCEEERYDHPLKMGDVNLRFIPALTAKDGLDWLIEIKTRWLKSRSVDVLARAEQIRARLNRLGVASVGVWIELHTAGWAQD